MNPSRMEISFEVAGWPPIKNEATSMLAAGHPHSARVRALLEAAREALRRTGWVAVTTDLALEVVVRAPGRPPGDATNFLGGIGDVLQDKTTGRNINVEHLGELRTVALYRDDRQIRQVSYREEASTEPSYSVRISSPDTVPTVAAETDTARENGCAS